MPRYTGKGDTQEDKILKLLVEARGGWVPAPALAKVCLQYCRAVSSLRKDSHDIRNRVEQHGKVRHGFYRLEGAVSEAEPKSRAVKKPAATVPMFSEPLVRRMD